MTHHVCWTSRSSDWFPIGRQFRWFELEIGFELGELIRAALVDRIADHIRQRVPLGG